MSKRFNLTVPTKYTPSGEEAEKTSYTSVGSAFINEKDGAVTSISIKLDFPVGVKELVAFPPKES